MGNRLVRRFAKRRDQLIVQSEITAEEFAALRDMLHPGMMVVNFVSGNVATVRSVCALPRNPLDREGTPYLPITRQILRGRRMGRDEKTHWFLLNVDVA